MENFQENVLILKNMSSEKYFTLHYILMMLIFTSNIFQQKLEEEKLSD
jgi:hypothetical protein